MTAARRMIERTQARFGLWPERLAADAGYGDAANLSVGSSRRRGIILGAYRSPTAVGLYEGPVRAHNLLYALGGALAVPTVPTASRYVATGDERILGELAVRGSPLHARAVRAYVRDADGARRADPRGVWLGDRYTPGGATRP